MKNKKLDFINISFKDSDLLCKLSKNQRFKSYLKNHKEINADFDAFSEKKKSRFTYCVCSSEDKLLSLIITANVSREPPDYMKPWIAEEKETLWMDVVFLAKEEPNPEEAAELLAAFIVHCPKGIGALLSDPEATQSSTVALYEMVGFTRVSTFIKGQGFFKGTSHYLMKLPI